MIDERDATIREQARIMEEQTERLEHLEILLEKAREHKILFRLMFHGET